MAAVSRWIGMSVLQLPIPVIEPIYSGIHSGRSGNRSEPAIPWRSVYVLVAATTDINRWGFSCNRQRWPSAPRYRSLDARMLPNSGNPAVCCQLQALVGRRDLDRVRDSGRHFPKVDLEQLSRIPGRQGGQRGSHCRPSLHGGPFWTTSKLKPRSLGSSPR